MTPYELDKRLYTRFIQGDRVYATSELHKQFRSMARLGTVTSTPRDRYFVNVRVDGQRSVGHYAEKFWVRVKPSEERQLRATKTPR